MYESRRWRRYLVFGLLLLVPWTGCNSNPVSVPDDNDPSANEPLDKRSGSGTALVSGVVESADALNPLPLGGVRISLGDAFAHTNVDGSFELQGVPAGRQVLDVDGRASRTGDGHYGQFRVEMLLAEEISRHLDRPIYLPFIPAVSQRSVRLDGPTTVMSGDGVILKIPPGAARLDGHEYDGVISIQTIPFDRTPFALPAVFADQTGRIVSIQPVGISFEVPVPITIPDRPKDPGPEPTSPRQDGASGPRQRFQTLWSLYTAPGPGEVVGFGQRRDGGTETTIGGVDVSSWHFFSEGIATELREPCHGEDSDSARACLAAGLELLSTVRARLAVTVAGARTAIGRFDVALLARGRSLSAAEDIIAVSRALFPVARDGIAAYHDFYHRIVAEDALGELVLALAGARAACGLGGACDGAQGATQIIAEELDRLMAASAANLDAYESRFDRLEAAVAPLATFFNEPGRLNADTLSAFQQLAEEFNLAYDDFAPFSSPVDAYEELVIAFQEMERLALDYVRAVSIAPAYNADASSAGLQRICNSFGLTALGAMHESIASLPLASDGVLNDACFIVAVNPTRGLVSIPVTEPRFYDALGSPAVIGLAGRLRVAPYGLGTLNAGVLTTESPVHAWTFDAPQRQGLDVAFSSEGSAYAGFATPGGSVQVGRPGGFAVANLTGEGSYALYSYGTELDRDGVVPYAFSVDLEAARFDYSQPVAGTFDVDSRAAAVLFEGQAGDRFFVERRCCDPFGELFRQHVFGPHGAVLSPLDTGGANGAVVDGTYELASSGLHRLILAPFAGLFAEYEVVIDRIPVNEITPYTLATVATVTLDDEGESVRFSFAALAGDDILLEGVSSDGMDPVLVTVIDPGGDVVVENARLFFDGSSFSTRTFDLPSAGIYEIIFRADLDTLPRVGSFSFRLGELAEGRGT